METALIVYASMTGNTKRYAHFIGELFESKGVSTTIKECSTVSPKEFLAYDICLVGTYTFGSNGDLPDEIDSFYEALQNVDLPTKKYATFGSGEEAYGHFCKAAFDFDKQFSKTGAKQAAPPLGIELDTPIKTVLEMLNSFVETICGPIV